MISARDPAAVRHDTLLPERFRRPEGDDGVGRGETQPRRSSFGVRAGVLRSSLSDRGDGVRLGARVGAFVRVPIGAWVALEGGAAFVRKGDSAGALDYVAAEPEGRLRVARLGPVAFELAAGAALAIALRAQRSGEDVQRFELSGRGGISAGAGRYSVDLRYEHGVTRALDLAGRNRVLALSLAIEL